MLLWVGHEFAMHAHAHTYLAPGGTAMEQFPLHTCIHTHTPTSTHTQTPANASPSVSPIRKDDETILESYLLRRALERAERSADEVLVPERSE